MVDGLFRQGETAHSYEEKKKKKVLRFFPKVDRFRVMNNLMFEKTQKQPFSRLKKKY